MHSHRAQVSPWPPAEASSFFKPPVTCPTSNLLAKAGLLNQVLDHDTFLLAEVPTHGVTQEVAPPL